MKIALSRRAAGLKWVTAAVCTYEVTAIVTGRVPTVTALCCRHRALGPLLITALTADICYAQIRARRCS